MRKFLGIMIAAAAFSAPVQAQQLPAVVQKLQELQDKSEACADQARPAAERLAVCNAAFEMASKPETMRLLTLFGDIGSLSATSSDARPAVDSAAQIRAMILAARSEVKLDTGDLGGAIADTDAADKLWPRHAGILNSRCWTRAVAKRDLDAARGYCKAAIAIRRDANIFDSLGLVNLQQRRWQDAWDAYNEAVSMEPSFTTSLYGRGLAALALGKTAEGEADIAKAGEAAAEFAGYGLTPESMKAKPN